MKFSLLFITVFLVAALMPAQAQPPGKRPAWMIGVSYSALIPRQDMADNFNQFSNVGLSFGHKSKNNIILSAEFNYLFGGGVKEPVFQNLLDKSGNIPVYTGGYFPPEINMQGFAIFLQAAKVFQLGKNNPGSGIKVEVGAGYLQHKYNIPGAFETVPQVAGDYELGYDRLTSGFALRESVSYHFLSRKGFVCFSIGLEFMQGFTQGRRNFQYDTRQAYDQNRKDFTIGPRFAWYLPLYHYSNKQEDYYFR